MSGFSSHYGHSPQSNSSSKSPNGFQSPPLTKAERRSERLSQSSSDGGDFVNRGEPKIEENDEDGHSLTSQTLNADGTPKRPMNAFMIFARRRRPQVSAQNQSMRTGEISKILSREWVSMPPSEKQFYLEQAKQLKETFNTKYPDYVYRRRPNNSRKRRRSDGASLRPVDHGLLDHPDDMNGSFDLDASPTDGDDHLDAALPYQRPPPDGHHGTDQKFSPNQSRSSINHSYSPDTPFRSEGHDSTRLPYTNTSNSDRVGPGMSGNGPSGGMALSALHYSYSQSSNHSQSPPLFPSDSVSGHHGWQHRGSSWLNGGQDRLPPPQPQKSNSYSPPASWSTPTEPSTSGSSNFFPTLSTPFYPNQPNASSFISGTSSSSSHSVHQQATASSQFESVNSMQSNSVPRDFSSRTYNGTTSLSSSSNSYGLGRDPYFQRTLPPMQTLSGFSSQPISSSSGSSGSPPAFWRD